MLERRFEYVRKYKVSVLVITIDIQLSGISGAQYQHGSRKCRRNTVAKLADNPAADLDRANSIDPGRGLLWRVAI